MERKAVKLARETKDIKIPDSYEKMEPMHKEIQMARTTAERVKRRKY